MAPQQKRVSVDVDEFVRTRDALTTAFMTLSSSVDKAVKAYIEHTNAVLAGDASLNVSYLTEPFNALNVAAGVTKEVTKALKTSVPVVEASAGADEEEGKKKRKRAYKPRDPNAPKRPLTAYFRYLSEVRPLLTIELAKTPGINKPGELSKVATGRWKELSDAQRKPYHDAYQAAKTVYEQEVEDYKTRTGQLVDDDDEEEEDPSVAKPVVAATTAKVNDESEDDSSSSEDEPAPPPAKVKKSASPEAVKKTPKASAVEKTPKTAKSKPTTTPMFNSINPAPTASAKKRKSEAADETAPKKKRGRPSNAELAAREAAKAAAAEDDDSSTEEEQPKKKEKAKKKKAAEA